MCWFLVSLDNQKSCIDYIVKSGPCLPWEKCLKCVRHINVAKSQKIQIYFSQNNSAPRYLPLTSVCAIMFVCLHSSTSRFLCRWPRHPPSVSSYLGSKRTMPATTSSPPSQWGRQPLSMSSTHTTPQTTWPDGPSISLSGCPQGLHPPVAQAPQSPLVHRPLQVHPPAPQSTRMVFSSQANPQSPCHHRDAVVHQVLHQCLKSSRADWTAPVVQKLIRTAYCSPLWTTVMTVGQWIPTQHTQVAELSTILPAVLKEKWLFWNEWLWRRKETLQSLSRWVSGTHEDVLICTNFQTCLPLCR